MIDAVVNTLTGPAIVHDEPDLEGATALLVGEGGRCAVLRADGSVRVLSRDLDDEMRAAFSGASSCPFIRLEGRRIASRRAVSVSSRQA
jgi:hypothetical protein